MADNTIIVTIEENGARVFSMDRVKIRYELPNFEGAMAVVDSGSDSTIYGQINYVDLKALEQYSWDNSINVRTGECDPIGILRVMAEVKEAYEHARQARKFQEEPREEEPKESGLELLKRTWWDDKGSETPQ